MRTSRRTQGAGAKPAARAATRAWRTATRASRRSRAALGVPLAAILALGASGCGGVLATTASSRFEGRVLGEGARPTALQVAPAVRWEPAPGALAGSVSYSPSVVLEPGSPLLVRHRAGVDVGAARAAGLRPYGHVSLDYGTVRSGDLAPGELAEARPKAETLESYAVRLEGGWRGRVSRRAQLALGAGVDRSAGVGSAAATLPALTRAVLTVRGERRRTRALTLDGGVKVTGYTLQETALLLEADTRATLRLSRGFSLSATAGGAAARGSARPVAAGGSSPAHSMAGGAFAARPVAAVHVSWEPPGGRLPRVGASVATRPEFDRLDGGLRQRLHVQAALGAELWRDARLGAGVQWAGDVAGEGERRSMLAADATFMVELSSEWSAEAGVRAFVQGGATAPGARDPSEARVRLGLSHRLGVR